MVTEVEIIEDQEEEPPEPLRMEHFHLPLGMWFVGILISLLCFVAEIIKHRKTNVPMARLGGMFLSDTEAAQLDLPGSENIEDIEDTP